MAQSSESLLQMISNLKISAVANDTAAMNHRIDQRTEELKGAEDGNRDNKFTVIYAHHLYRISRCLIVCDENFATERMQALVTLGQEVSKLLQELEAHYYSCPS